MRRAAVCCGLAALVAGSGAIGLRGDTPAARETDLAQLATAVAGTHCVAQPIDLTGVVLWVNGAHDELVLQAGTNVLPVKMDLAALPGLVPGRQVRLSGSGTAGLGCLNEALVDNDGLHSVTEKSGTVSLSRGRHALRVDWFNGPADAALTVEYAGPGMPRQPIPAGVLFRTNAPAETGGVNLPGLSFRGYQGQWEWLPTWRNAIPFNEGTVTNFNIAVRTRAENAGLEFSGYLSIERAGQYTFWTTSDDGSRLYLGDTPLRLEMLGDALLPTAEKIQPGQKLVPGRDCFWAEAEGTVTGVHVDSQRGWQMELAASAGRLFVESDLATLTPPMLFSRLRVTGLCRSVVEPGHGSVAGRLLVSEAGQIQELAPPPAATNATATTVAELRRLGASGHRTGCWLCLRGTVLATGASPGLFAFQDATGGTIVQMDTPAVALQPGQEIQITGSGVLDRNLFLVCDAPVVDNDGMHAVRERTGAVFLTAGKHPLHLSWFNRTQAAALKVFYQGPGVPRQEIPDPALVHPEFDSSGRLVWAPGLTYENYEGDWRHVPGLARLSPVNLGTAKNFTLHAAARAAKTGLEFNGFLDVPRNGQYFFTLSSHDGSQLFLDESAPHVEVLGSHPLPASLPVASRQILESHQSSPWSQTEGTVNFASERDGALFLEVGSGYGPISVEVVDATGASPLLLLGSRVKVLGFCQATQTPGGQSVAGAMVTPGIAQIEIQELSPAQWNRYPRQSIRQLAASNDAAADELIAHVRGWISEPAAAGPARLRDDFGTIDLQWAAPLAGYGTNAIEVLGRLNRSETNLVLTCAVGRVAPGQLADAPNRPPLLTSVRQVKQLSREQAQRGYPVKLRGVITLVRGNQTGFIIQDDTSAIDVWWTPYANTSLPRVGDYWEVEGETFAEFSPNIRTHNATRLGVGTLPEPIHPAWDQLLNGSLDTLYVELQGIVTAVESDAVMLLTRDGKIRVLLSPVTPELLKHTENALVRIRGCVVPVRDQNSQEVRVGQIRLSNVSLNLDEPAPADPFATSLKHASELLQFDARAGSLQRVKLAGQIMHAGDGEIFLRDGDTTVRVLPQRRTAVSAGDLTEVVGFPELGGPSPVLREAVLRPTGEAPLPAPVVLPGEALFSKGHDGWLISVPARLIGLTGNETERLLELQSGSREFLARLANRQGALPRLIPGSQLELTGVYAEQEGRPDQAFTSFELLLNSPAAVTVLELPPWWTLRRALIFAGGLAATILAALVWIQLLRRRVEERTAQLAVEIRRREQVQRQSDLERERTRIAKDMHDHLGTSVTRVSLLAELTKNDALDAGKTAAHAEKISETAIELGRTLDEIVWAVNPKNDSLDRFCDYVAVQAQELFQLTDVLCRVDLPPEMPRHPLSAELRHNLFLAAKEALNNVVRHAQAKEVWVRFQLQADRFQICIVDDGVGFDPEATSGRRNGLQNMQRRLEETGGRFALTSQPGRGTRVTLEFGLAQTSESTGAQTVGGRPAESSLASHSPGS